MARGCLAYMLPCFCLDSDNTGHQNSWPSTNASGTISGVALATCRQDPKTSGPTSPRAPLAVSDDVNAFDVEGDCLDGYDEDTSTADYFTYDEGHRSRHNTKHHGRGVIRRPHLSPPCKWLFFPGAPLTSIIDIGS